MKSHRARLFDLDQQYKSCDWNLERMYLDAMEIAAELHAELFRHRNEVLSMSNRAIGHVATIKQLRIEVKRMDKADEKRWAAMRQMYKVTEGASIDTLHEHMEPECYEHDYKYERG